MWSAGTARSPIRGDVGLEVDMSPDTGPACLHHMARRRRRRRRIRERIGLRQSGRVLTRPPAGTIPDAPGSYQFRDRDGRVIYVGKAKSLRSRLSNYFQNPANLPVRTAQMVAQAESVEWIQVRNDVEAVMLEYSLIKQHKPALQHQTEGRQELSVPGRDRQRRVAAGHGEAGDQGQGQPLFRPLRPRLCHPRDPRLAPAHLPDPHLQRQQVSHPPAAREALPAVPHRKVLRPLRRRYRPGAYQGLVGELVAFLDGDTQPVVKSLEAEMLQASDALEYERAGRLRDRLTAVRKAIEKQQMVVERAEDLDCFGLVEDELEAAIQVFYVRRGRVVGRKGFIVDKVEDLDRAQLVAQVLEQHYADAPPVSLR